MSELPAAPPLVSLMMGRRSLRAFSDRPVDGETLGLLKEATLRAPTAGNQMFYSVIEVDDPGKKKALAVLCDNQPFIASAPLVWIFLADCQKWENFYNEGGSVARGVERGVAPRKCGLGDLRLALQDAIIAAQNAAIAAEALGLGSCFIGDVVENHEKMKALLGLKPLTAVAAMLVAGWPKNPKRNGRRTKRCPATSIFMRNSYREPHLDQLRRAYAAQEEDLRRTGGLPDGNKGTIADRYYFVKHTSAFMEEMNRSAEAMVRDWLGG